jgi:signal peptidase I
MKNFRRITTGVVLCALLATLGGGAWLLHRGYRVYAIRTGSMTPTYVPGDAVIDAPTAGRTPDPGDVITFRGGPAGVTTHRVHRVLQDGIQTKGDANRTPDIGRVATTGVVGKVIHAVPHGGYVLYFLSQGTGVGAVVSTLVALALLWSLFFPGTPATAPAVTPGSARSRTWNDR